MAKANIKLPTSNTRQRSLPRRKVCFVTGTRAEFGLMQSTLMAIRDHASLELQIVATGMHLSTRHGRTVDAICAAGWKVDATVSWTLQDAKTLAIQTGKAIAGLALALERLKTDIVVVAGDRVEAFAGATAAHLSGRIVAHVHGGDRAMGQVDDSLRHAITKLAHLHFPATSLSKSRLLKLGEDPWRVHRVGSPGIDGITLQAAPSLVQGRYVLLVLHPTDDNEMLEFDRASMLLDCVNRIGFDSIVIVYPNNDPGYRGIIQCWENAGKDVTVLPNVDRPRFLGLMRDAAVLIGNSSSGIIEAASFGTPVIDIGPRQQGRERSKNVSTVAMTRSEIDGALRYVWNGGKPIRYPKKNVYGGDGAGRNIASILAKLAVNLRLSRKLIAY